MGTNAAKVRGPTAQRRRDEIRRGGSNLRPIDGLRQAEPSLPLRRLMRKFELELMATMLELPPQDHRGRRRFA